MKCGKELFSLIPFFHLCFEKTSATIDICFLIGNGNLTPFRLIEIVIVENPTENKVTNTNTPITSSPMFPDSSDSNDSFCDTISHNSSLTSTEEAMFRLTGKY